MCEKILDLLKLDNDALISGSGQPLWQQMALCGDKEWVPNVEANESPQSYAFTTPATHVGSSCRVGVWGRPTGGEYSRSLRSHDTPPLFAYPRSCL